MDFATLHAWVAANAPKAELVVEEGVVYYRATNKSAWYEITDLDELAVEVGASNEEEVDDVEEINDAPAPKAAPAKRDPDRHPAADDAEIGKMFVTITEQGKRLHAELNTAESGRRAASMDLRHAIKGHDEALVAEGQPFVVGPNVMNEGDGSLIVAARRVGVLAPLAERLAKASTVVAAAAKTLCDAYEQVKRTSGQITAATAAE